MILASLEKAKTVLKEITGRGVLLYSVSMRSIKAEEKKIQQVPRLEKVTTSEEER